MKKEKIFRRRNTIETLKRQRRDHELKYIYVRYIVKYLGLFRERIICHKNSRKKKIVFLMVLIFYVFFFMLIQMN